MIHHTDQGAIYASPIYREVLERRGLRASMSRKGNAWDNAVAESVFSSLKNELVHHCRFVNQAEARGAVFTWIEGFCNRRRIHSTLDFVSPSDYEARHEIRSPTCPEIRGWLTRPGLLLGQASGPVMTIYVNIGEAKTRLSQLVAAALRGEDVVLQKAGEPKVRLVPISEAAVQEAQARAARRAAAIGFARAKYAHLPPEAFDVPPATTDEDLDERKRREFDAPPA